jgi:hypothetical protein
LFSVSKALYTEARRREVSLRIRRFAKLSVLGAFAVKKAKQRFVNGLNEMLFKALGNFHL